MTTEPSTQPGHTEPQARRMARKDFLVYLALASSIALLLSLQFLLKDRAFAFVDIGIDLFSYYYPIQIIQAQQLQQLHDLAWSFQLGLGGYIGTVFNPTQLATAWLPEAWQLGVRLPTFFLRLILAGAFFFGYLRKIRFDPGLATIGALAFSFSCFSIVNGQWDSQGLILLQFAAYLFFFEGYFRSANLWYAVAAGLTAGFGQAFDTFSLALLSLLYITIRPAFVRRKDDDGSFVPALFRFACFAALGYMLTAIVQLPNLQYLLDSPRVSGEHAKFSALFDKLGEINNLKVIRAEVAGMFGKDLLGTGSDYHGWSNYFEAPGFYVGMLMLLCIPQLLGPIAKRRERMLCIAGLALLSLYMVWPAMRYAVYGFGHTGFRLSTLWVSAGLLVLGLAGLRRALESGVWRPGLAATGAGIAIVLLTLAWFEREAVVVGQVALILAFTGVYAVILWHQGRDGSRMPVRVLACIFACELLVFSIPSLMQRTAVRTDGSSIHGSYHDGTQDALALIHHRDPSSEFYRIEKTYRSVFLNDALVQGYSGTKSYFFHGRSLTRFVDKMHLPRPHPRTNYIGSMKGRRDVLDLLGVKYLLSRDRKPGKVRDMAYLGRAGKIHVYRNTTAHGIGHLYQEVVSEDAANKLPVSRRDALLLKRVIVDDPQDVRARLASLDKSQPTSGTGLQSRVSLRKLSDIHLQADISAPRASVLLVAMPFEAGWTATLDGNRAAAFRADYGLTALVLPPGQHQVELRYAVPGRALGRWLSLAALALLIGIGAFQVVSERRRSIAAGMIRMGR
jgi:hypothetical protein